METLFEIGRTVIWYGIRVSLTGAALVAMAVAGGYNVFNDHETEQDNTVDDANFTVIEEKPD